MKKIFVVFLTLLLTLSMGGCGSDVSQNEYAAVCAERDELKAELNELKVQLDKMQKETKTNSPDTIKGTISGYFLAIVRYLMPDYILDGKTLNVAVVTEFLSEPIAIYVGEIGEQLEVGKAYAFELETIENVEIAQSEYQSMQEYVSYDFDVERLFLDHNVRIKSVRLVDYDELGLACDNIVFEPYEQ